MIIKSSTRGSRGLGAHLEAEENEIARVTRTEGIVSFDTEVAVAELVAQGAGSRTRKPLVHASISPDQLMTDQQWDRAWSEWERARGLSGQPYLEVEHVKKGRVHRHRVYCRVDIDRQAVIRQSHEKRINERVARSLEAEFGHDLTPGAHNRAVQYWALQHGYAELTERMAGAAEGPRPEAAMPQRAWQQQERTGVDARELAAAVADAWQRSDSAAALAAALEENGLALAQGRKTPQVIDSTGEAHDLRRTLRAGGESVRAADVRAKIPEGLQPVDHVREAQRAAARTAAAAPADAVIQGPDDYESEGTPAEQAPAGDSAAPASAAGTEAHPRPADPADEDPLGVAAPPPAPRRPERVESVRSLALAAAEGGAAVRAADWAIAQAEAGEAEARDRGREHERAAWAELIDELVERRPVGGAVVAPGPVDGTDVGCWAATARIVERYDVRMQVDERLARVVPQQQATPKQIASALWRQSRESGWEHPWFQVPPDVAEHIIGMARADGRLDQITMYGDEAAQMLAAAQAEAAEDDIDDPLGGLDQTPQSGPRNPGPGTGM